MDRLAVDTQALRAAAAEVGALAGVLRSAVCGSGWVDDGAVSSTPAGREAADLLTRRVQEVPEYLGAAAGTAAVLAESLDRAAAVFEAVETVVGPH